MDNIIEEVNKIRRKTYENDKRRTILIVEDSRLSQVQLTDVLKGVVHEKKDISIKVVEDGEEALEEYKKNFDILLIITDIKMPKLSGHTLARVIREIESITNRPFTPIVSVSAYKDEGTEEKNYYCGIEENFSKPIRASRLGLFLRNKKIIK